MLFEEFGDFRKDEQGELMAKVIGVMGESGSGKTTSLDSLDPNTTFYINCDKKDLPFPKKIRNQYKEENRNYFKTDNQGTVLNLLEKIDKQDNMKKIKVVVIDTLNGIMVADERRRMKEKNYDKWADLAWSVYDIIDYSLSMRDDVTVILIAHVQTDRDDNGYMFSRIKTSGKKLDKIGIETKLTTVLYSKALPDGRYIFETHANNSTAKTPKGAFAQSEIPNNMAEVLKVLEEF